MNIMLYIIEIIFMFIILWLSYKKFDIEGIYIVMIICILLSNFLYYKEIEIMNIIVGIDLVIISTIFTINNVIVQKKGKIEGNNLICLIIMIISLSYIILSLSQFLYISDINYKGNLSYNNIFLISKRDFFAYNISMILGLLINNNIYYLLRKEYNITWLSHIVSTIVSQLVFSLIYLVLLYFGKYSFIDIILMILLRSFILSIISIIYIKVLHITCK